MSEKIRKIFCTDNPDKMTHTSHGNYSEAYGFYLEIQNTALRDALTAADADKEKLINIICELCHNFSHPYDVGCENKYGDKQCDYDIVAAWLAAKKKVEGNYKK
jgi:hypothetical protein